MIENRKKQFSACNVHMEFAVLNEQQVLINNTSGSMLTSLFVSPFNPHNPVREV